MQNLISMEIETLHVLWRMGRKKPSLKHIEDIELQRKFPFIAEC